MEVDSCLLLGNKFKYTIHTIALLNLLYVEDLVILDGSGVNLRYFPKGVWMIIGLSFSNEREKQRLLGALR